MGLEGVRKYTITMQREVEGLLEEAMQVLERMVKEVVPVRRESKGMKRW